MMYCAQATCRCETRHEQSWIVHPSIKGSLYAYSCCNCGRQKLGRNVRFSGPDLDETRWATKEELRLARKVQKGAA